VIISFGNQKGGVGKSMLSYNLAVTRALAGHDVLLVDTDPQATAAKMVANRFDEQLKPDINCVQLIGAASMIAQLKNLASKYEDIIIDAGGSINEELRASMMLANKVFIPVVPKQIDIWAVVGNMTKLVHDIRSLREGFRPFLVVNMAPTNPTLRRKIRTALEVLREYKDSFSVLPNFLSLREPFSDSIIEGKGVVEYVEPDHNAFREMIGLYKRVFDLGIDEVVDLRMGNGDVLQSITEEHGVEDMVAIN
jgi:chromosome partitioning protein